MTQLFKMAFRDLGRNRRRSALSAIALGIGVALLLLIAAFVQGELDQSLTSAVKLQSGNLQVRAKTYDEAKTSLAFQDLIEKPADLATKITAQFSQVAVATPRLFANGIVTTGDQSLGVRIVGIDPDSPANAPFKDGLVSGEFLTTADSGGIVVGQSMANKAGLQTGAQVNLLVNTSNGDVDQQTFTIRGIYTTHTPGIDNYYVFLSLPKAQAFSKAGDHASAIFILLKNKDDTPAVAAALQSSAYQVLTFDDMNPLIVVFNQYYNALMGMIYLVVLAITATVIVNTLIMSVFERTREIGILSAIGMKSGSIMGLFFAESSLLAVGGLIIGWVLGVLLVLYFGSAGFSLADFGVTGILLGDRIYAHLTVPAAVTLSIMALIVTLLAGIYPARMAANMEPVTALRSGGK
jgi:ABC-type lipoprotein release transport system permease subunit